MDITPPASDDITVVLIDSTTPDALVRCVQQVVRTGSGCQVVVVSARATSLPSHLARRTRTVRVSEAAALDGAAASEASARALVLVAPTSAAFSTGWPAAVRERARVHSQTISVVGAHGRSILVVPRAVTDVRASRSSWVGATGLRLRESAHEVTARRTISAVMIVKDEEEVLDECLAALVPFVDEVVVYDTGSTDRTVDIARSHGVVVVEGYWNDHFGDARNRALEHATSDWVIQVDADEVMEGDVDAWRRQLDTDPYDQISITIISTAHRGSTTGLTTQPSRIFRRGYYRWTGALHEYPLALPGIPARGMSPQQPPVRLMHSGYQPQRTAERNKAMRNLALSTKELEATPKGDPERAVLLSNQGRTLLWAGKTDEALEVLEELRTTPGNPTSIVIGGRAALEVLLATHRTDEVEPWLEVMASNGEAPGNIAVYRARKHIKLNEPTAALDAVSSLTDGGGTDPWGMPFDPARAQVIEAAAKISLGDPHTGADLLLVLVRTASDAVPFDLIVNAVSAAGRRLVEIAGIAPNQFIERTIREASAMHPVVALEWFEALHEANPHDRRPVVAGNLFAARAAWTVALAWSVRARELGLEEVCALRGLGENQSMPVVDRVMAWLVLASVLGEHDAPEQVARLVAHMDPRDLLVLRSHAEQHGLDASTLVTSARISLSSPAATPLVLMGEQR